MRNQPRSNRAVVRNPMLALPAMKTLRMLDPGTRLVLARLLNDLADDARQRAEQCWRKHKAPMAAYWKAVAVYAKHIARAVEQGPRNIDREAA